MSSIFCAISFIKNVSGSPKCCHGTAVYRTGTADFVEYKFKAFRFTETTLVEEISQSNISLIVGRFAFVNNELHIIVEQNIPLNILTLGDFPTIYDLPISSAFGVFTGHVQDASTIEGETTTFQLRRDAYDGVISSKVIMSILCKYELLGCHQNVSEATQQQPIFSIAEELVTLKKSVCILCDVIEWSNPNQNNSKTSDNKQNLKDKKCRNEDLEKLAKKFDKSPSNNSTQQESNGETQ